MKYSSVVIENSFGKGGTNEHGRWFPRTVSTFCPYCDCRGYFVFSYRDRKQAKHAVTATSKCPGCEEAVEFTLFYGNNALNPDPIEVIMFPSPTLPLAPMQLPADLPERIGKAVRDAEAAFRAGLYSPSLTCAGMALEGLLRVSSGEGSKTTKLFELVEQFCTSGEAVKPISHLAHSIRNGRNAGSHFDELFEANSETAQLMLELLRDFLAYFYEFEAKAKQLSKQIAG